MVPGSLEVVTAVRWRLVAVGKSEMSFSLTAG